MRDDIDAGESARKQILDIDRETEKRTIRAEIRGQVREFFRQNPHLRYAVIRLELRGRETCRIAIAHRWAAVGLTYCHVLDFPRHVAGVMKLGIGSANARILFETVTAAHFAHNPYGYTSYCDDAPSFCWGVQP